MKTMMSVDGNKIIRVSDEKASQLYSEGFRYVAKSMWKEKVRDVNKSSEEPTKTKANYRRAVAMETRTNRRCDAQWKDRMEHQESKNCRTNAWDRTFH